MGFGLRLLFVPLAYLGLAVLFCVSIASSTLVGQMTGSNTILLSLPLYFIDRTIEFSSGDLWSGVFIFFNFIQCFVVGWLIKAFVERSFLRGGFCLFLAVVFTVFSFTTGLIWRATDADLRDKQNAMTQEAFQDLKVEKTKLYNKTQKIAPRGQEIIRAEIDQLMSKRVKSRGKHYTLKKYSSSCRTIYARAQRDCERYFKLKHELAESVDYTANKRHVKEVSKQQKSNLVADPNIGFTYVAKIIGVKDSTDKKGATAAETIEKWRILGPQALVELLTLFGLTFIRWGMRGASMPPHGEPKNPCRNRNNETEINGESVDVSIDESVDRHAGTPSVPLKVIEGGKVACNSKSNSRFAVCDNSSLIAFAAHVGDTGLVRVPEFMDKYRAFCQLHNLRPLAKNVIGTLLEPIGGEKGHKFIPFWSEAAGREKQSKRILWRLSYANIQLREDALEREVA